MSELHEQRDRATSFGSIARLYDEVRPTYPDALVRDLLATSPHDVLDVGCGTGRAAMLFAAQGASVLGVEPDPAMAEVARGHGVEVEVADFEHWDDRGRRFDLLVSGQAWHWVDPDAGAVKAREVLNPGGVVGLFWNTDSMAAGDRSALDAAYREVAPEQVDRMYGGMRGPRTIVREALVRAGFADVDQREYSWQRHYSPEQYTRLIATFSDHNQLPADRLEALTAAVRQAVETTDGLDIAYECQLVSAVNT